VVIRTGSLSVEGQEPNFVHVTMCIINKDKHQSASRPTTMNE
jgi:hypothetical protein